jgi:L-threonylcarbamoyladenylate synthase
MPPTLEEQIEMAASALQRGEVLAFPTETVYGLGADALNPIAIANIFAIKGRPRFNPLIVHVPNIQAAQALVSEFPAVAMGLAKRFWPGPLTLVLPKTKEVPDLVTAGLAFVGLRVPAHPLALQLLNRAGLPLAAPSANRFGGLSPTTASAVVEQLGPEIFVIDGGACQIGVESTIVGFLGGEHVLLRHGGLAIEEIEKVVGHPLRERKNSAEPLAPGMLKKHYAPKTPLVLETTAKPEANCGLLCFSRKDAKEGYDKISILSENGDLKEAAAQLFKALRTLDACKLKRIDVLLVPNVGLGRAINDRLERAAAE